MPWKSFDVIMSSAEIRVSKPDPAIYLATAKRLGIAPKQGLCIENSLLGMQAGLRVNMYVINIPDPNSPLPEEQKRQADLILASLGELSDEIINELEALR